MPGGLDSTPMPTIGKQNSEKYQARLSELHRDSTEKRVMFSSEERLGIRELGIAPKALIG
jgi:hypothetical protein